MSAESVDPIRHIDPVLPDRVQPGRRKKHRNDMENEKGSDRRPKDKNTEHKAPDDPKEPGRDNGGRIDILI